MVGDVVHVDRETALGHHDIGDEVDLELFHQSGDGRDVIGKINFAIIVLEVVVHLRHVLQVELGNIVLLHHSCALDLDCEVINFFP